jgi:hypothetical protein
MCVVTSQLTPPFQAAEDRQDPGQVLGKGRCKRGGGSGPEQCIAGGKGGTAAESGEEQPEEQAAGRGEVGVTTSSR